MQTTDINLVILNAYEVYEEHLAQSGITKCPPHMSESVHKEI